MKSKILLASLFVLGFQSARAINPVITATPIGSTCSLEICNLDPDMIYSINWGDGTPIQQYVPSPLPPSGCTTLTHSYPQNTFLVSVFFAKKKQASPPAMVSAPVIITAAGGGNNPPLMMAQSVQLGTSWLPVYGQKHFTVLTFTNTISADPINGSVEFHYDSFQSFDPLEINTYGGCTIVVPSTNSGQPGFFKKYTLNFSGLKPGEQRSVFFFGKNYAQPGQEIKTKAIFLARAYTDKHGNKQAGSRDEVTLPVKVAAFPHDPNFKTVRQTEICPFQPDPAQLDYHISFQNDGEAFAADVMVTDDLDIRLDAGSVQIDDSSSPCSLVLDAAGNSVRFEFWGINLPGLNQLSPFMYTYNQTIGWVDFRVNTVACLEPGEIPNRANIVFDKLDAVGTDVATVLVAQADNCVLDCGERSAPARPDVSPLLAGPNPFSDLLKISLLNSPAGETAQLEIFDVQGKTRLLKTIADDGETLLETAGWPTGTYFLRLASKSGIQTTRLVKH